MKIRMTVEMPEGATRNGQPWPKRGQAVELPTAEAAHLVASGVAEEVAEPEKPKPGAEKRRARPPQDSADTRDGG